MLGAVSGAMDAVSSALGGNLPGAPGGNADLVFYKGANLGKSEQSAAGSQAPELLRPIDAGAVIEFIHIGYVHLDVDKNFNHTEARRDDIVEVIPAGAKLRGFRFRAALHREALLLSCFMTGCQSVLDANEKSKGGLGEMVGMAADMLGAGGSGQAAPKAADVNAFGAAVKTAIAKGNTAALTYKDMQQCGVDLHQARCNYRAFLKKLLDPPKNDPTSGLLGKLPVLGPAIPPKIGDILNFVTGLAFKPMDVYQALYVRIAMELEPTIEKAVNRYTIAELLQPSTPAFYLWYPIPGGDAAPAAGGGGGGGTGISFIDDAKRRFDALKSDVEGFGKKIRDFIEPDPNQPPAPGEPYLQEAFQVTIPPAPPGTALPPPPKELAGLVLNAFKAALDVKSLPEFIETIITEIVTINNEFLRELYKKLMERPAVQPINELEVYEAARKRILDRLVALVMDNVSFLRQAKDFNVAVQGMNVQPGEALLEKGLDELNDEVLRRLNVVLELAMGELVDKLEGLRQQAGRSRSLAMEAYMGFFPWLLALNFRNTFLPVWQLIMDNTFGKISGPLGDAVRTARDAMNAAKSKVDDARTVAMRLQRIKDRVTREGLQAGSSGQNLTGYQQDWAAELPPDQIQPKGPVVPFFPFDTRIESSTAAKITKSEYDTVKTRWNSAGDPA